MSGDCSDITSNTVVGDASGVVCFNCLFLSFLVLHKLKISSSDKQKIGLLNTQHKLKSSVGFRHQRVKLSRSRIAGKFGKTIRSLPATSMPRRFNATVNGDAMGLRCWTRTMMSRAINLPESINVFILSATLSIYCLRVVSSSNLATSLCNSTAPGASMRKHLCSLFAKPEISVTPTSVKKRSTVFNIGAVERKLCANGISAIVRIFSAICSDIVSRLSAKARGSAPWNP